MPRFRKGFALLFLIFGILIVVLISAGGYLFFARNDRSKSFIQEKLTTLSNNPTWVGVIWTGKGFMTIDFTGKIDKDSNGQVNITLPPGMSSDYVYENFGNDDEDFLENAFQLLDDGRMVFIGSPEISTADKRDTFYSWTINSSEIPKPVFTIPNGQKIQRLMFSPDKQQVALIAVTRDHANLFEETEDYKALPSDVFLKEYEKRQKQLCEELATVNIFDIHTQELVKTLKVDKTGECEGDRLDWRGNYLYVFDTFMFWVFDMSNYQLVYTSPRSTGSLGENITISPDGTKFMVPGQVVKIVPSKEVLVNFESRTLAGYDAFAFDSKRMLIMKPTPQTADVPVWLGDVGEIGELHLDDGKMESFGSLESLIPGLQLDSSEGESYFLVPFIVYNPTSDYIIFSVGAHEGGYPGRTRRVDLFSLKAGERVAKGSNLLQSIQSNDISDFVFVGWYKR